MNGKVKIVKLRIVYLLKKTPMILGCIVFLCSICYSFRHFYFVEDRGLFPMDVPIYGIDMWSFKVTVDTHLSNGQTSVTDYWFYDNWFYGNVPVSELYWINMAIFTSQILTLLTGVASLFINRRVLALAPLALCFTVTGLMLYVGINTGGTPLLGYRLTLLSIFLFLTAFPLELTSSRRSKHIQDTSSGNQ